MPSNRALRDLLGIKPANNAGLISIVASQTGNRLEACLRFIFEIGLQCHFEVVSDVKSAGSQHIIIYGQTNEVGFFTVPSCGFLFENKLRKFEPEICNQNNLPVLFPVSKVSFDLFSAVFYLVSRYEEWLPYAADEHGRFEAEQSFLNRNNLLHLPLVDLWLQNFKQQLTTIYPDIQLTDRNFRAISTLDIDNLYAYKGKGLKRIIGAATRDILNFNGSGFMERLQVLFNRKKDPFDIYEELSDFCFQHKIPLVCFFLMRSGTKYDRSLPPQSTFFQNVVATLKSNKAFVGLHPSYYSSTEPQLLEQEIRHLQNAGIDEVIVSRQHYLRGKFSQMPKKLAASGIQFDFSMGFASKAGFRAGTSLPFYYFDFDSESLINLVIVPFCAMDGVWSEYGSKSTTEAENDLKNLLEQIKKVNGLFVTVYHERSFSDHLYKGFGTLYKKLFSELTKAN